MCAREQVKIGVFRLNSVGEPERWWYSGWVGGGRVVVCETAVGGTEEQR